MNEKDAEMVDQDEGRQQDGVGGDSDGAPVKSGSPPDETADESAGESAVGRELDQPSAGVEARGGEAEASAAEDDATGSEPEAVTETSAETDRELLDERDTDGGAVEAVTEPVQVPADAAQKGSVDGAEADEPELDRDREEPLAPNGLESGPRALSESGVPEVKEDPESASTEAEGAAEAVDERQSTDDAPEQPTDRDSGSATETGVASDADDDDTSADVLPEEDESMLAEYESVVEGILFVSSEPVPVDQILDVFPARQRERAQQAVDAVFERYRVRDDRLDRGVMLDQAGGGYRLVTRPEIHSYLRKFFDSSHSGRLSMAALETLATVAYRQPITAPEIQEVRGRNSSGVLKTLLERRLVRISGRKDVVGKPFLYSTTRDFLLHFGLATLDDLPPLEEFEESFLEGDFSDAPDAGHDREEEVLSQLALIEEAEAEAEQEDEGRDRGQTDEDPAGGALEFPAPLRPVPPESDEEID